MLTNLLVLVAAFNQEKALSVIVKTERTFVSGSQHNPTTGDMIYCLLAAVLLIAVSRLCPGSRPN